MAALLDHRNGAGVGTAESWSAMGLLPWWSPPSHRASGVRSVSW